MYYFSKGQVKPNNKKYSSTNNDYQMTLGDRSGVEECLDADVNVDAMKAALQPVPIGRLHPFAGSRQLVDILAVATEVGPLGSVKRKKDNTELQRRDITLADKSGKTVTMTLWSGLATDQGARLEALTHPLIGAWLRDQLAAGTSAYCLLVNPILIESGQASRCDRVLVVDEADKAPLEVVCVLKALAEDGELALADGRTLARAGEGVDVAVHVAAVAHGHRRVDVHADADLRSVGTVVTVAELGGQPDLGLDRRLGGHGSRDVDIAVVRLVHAGDQRGGDGRVRVVHGAEHHRLALGALVELDSVLGVGVDVRLTDDDRLTVADDDRLHRRGSLDRSGSAHARRAVGVRHPTLDVRVRVGRLRVGAIVRVARGEEGRRG